MTKTFLLGVGCQRGGTTWLYRYLSGSPQFVPGYRKEYHVFDSLHLPAERVAKRRLLTQAANHAASPRPENPRAAGSVHRLSMFLDLELYFDYFTGLLHRSPDARLTADVTPAYGMLPAGVFDQIRQGFGARSVRTLPVLLMRDPVERIWSQMRMLARVRPEHEGRDESVDFLLANFAEPEYANRTRYHETVRTLDEVFGPDAPYYGFYERLFTEPEMRRLCDVAGIDFLEPGYEELHNVSPKPADLADDVVRTIARHYRDVYLGVAERFPEAPLRDLWPSSRFVL